MPQKKKKDKQPAHAPEVHSESEVSAKHKKKKETQSDPIGFAVGLHDFEGTSPKQMSFKQGQMLVVYKKKSNGWWVCQKYKDNDEERRSVPSTYVKECEEPVSEDEDGGDPPPPPPDFDGEVPITEKPKKADSERKKSKAVAKEPEISLDAKFEALLQDEQALGAFSKYIHKKAQKRNHLRFLSAVHEYREIALRHRQHRKGQNALTLEREKEDHAKTVYETFLDDASPQYLKEIKSTKAIKMTIVGRRAFPHDVFNEAYAQIKEQVLEVYADYVKETN
eukprot:gb/GEZN01011252.1/.p1 GENE.gb/GEZN01011252.1/~~gb/GEZN01011252.1/.p1  ORF type:complete len:279 (+),score=51.09 gb/GEZN01011252.1/:141-977(+)